MAEPKAARLREECVTLTRYLLGQDPSPHVVDKYLEAHRLAVVAPAGGLRPADHALMRWARRGGLFTRAADVHARFFEPGGLLRRKLVLLLGIIETDPEGRRRADTVEPTPFLRTFLRLAWLGVGSALLLVLGLPVFTVLKSSAQQGSSAAEELP